MSSLTELREKVERANGPDERLAIDILEALGVCSYIPDYGDPTASLDAARAFVKEVLPVAWIRLDEWTDATHQTAAVLPLPTPNATFGGKAVTLPLALVAACLRALESQEQAGDTVTPRDTGGGDRG